MAKPYDTTGKPQLSSPSVRPSTIAHFEQLPADTTQLYDELFKQNPELALWLRRRSLELAPDISERQGVSTLALEMLGILNRQGDLDSLNELLR